MDFALFLVALMGIMWLPDFPAANWNGSANGRSGLSDDADDVAGAGNTADLMADPTDDFASTAPANDLMDLADTGQFPDTEMAEETLLTDMQELDGFGTETVRDEPPVTHLVGLDSEGEIAFAEVSEFDNGQDVLAISMNSNAVDGTLDVDVVNSLSGEDSLVFVECELIAVLRGTPDVSAQDVMVKIVTMAA